MDNPESGWGTSLGTMASRPMVLLIGVGVGVFTMACSSDDPTPARSAAPETVSGLTYASDPDRLLDLHLPSGGPPPLVVILHGQGGSRVAPGPVAVAERLQSDGVAVAAVDYSVRSPSALVADGPRGLRTAVDEVRCAVAVAAGEVRDRYGDLGPVVMLGESAGGLVGSAHLGGRSEPTGDLACAATAEGAKVDGFVSWNGAVFIFHPQSPFHDAEAWAITDPSTGLATNPDVTSHFVLGGRDGQTPQWHRELVAELAVDLSGPGGLAELADADHNLPTAEPVLGDLAELMADVIAAI